MRKLLTITLALMLAALSTSALADGRHGRHDRGTHRDAYIAGGLLLGLVAGAALDNDHRDRYDDRYYDGYYSRSDYGYYDGPRRYGRDVVVYREQPRYYGPRYYGPRHRYGHGYAPRWNGRHHRHDGYRGGYRGW
jgi:hypothetical protein